MADRDAIEKENLRLTRRLRRLESNMEQLEEMRETNARLMDRLLVDLAAERQRSEALLLNVLPQRIVDRLHAGETTIADRHEDVAVVFSDFVGFTDHAARTPAPRLVGDLNALFSAFDAACDRYGVEKIKTIGDAYLAVAGLSAGAAARRPIPPSRPRAPPWRCEPPPRPRTAPGRSGSGSRSGRSSRA